MTQGFKQRDLDRALKSAKKAGIPVSMVEIAPEGSIRIFTASNTETGDSTSEIEAALQGMARGKSKNSLLRRA